MCPVGLNTGSGFATGWSDITTYRASTVAIAPLWVGTETVRSYCG